MPAPDSMPSPDEPAADAAWAPRLIALLENQQRLVDRLSALAARQGELIEHERADALLGVLKQRQRLVDELVATQHEFHEMTQNLQARLDRLDSARRDHIRELIRSIGSRLDSVMQQDQSDQNRLRTARDKTKNQLSELDRGAQARGAYLGRQGGAPAANRFADKKG